jgi:hypothetical protein
MNRFFSWGSSAVLSLALLGCTEYETELDPVVDPDPDVHVEEPDVHVDQPDVELRKGPDVEIDESPDIELPQRPSLQLDDRPDIEVDEAPDLEINESPSSGPQDADESDRSPQDPLPEGGNAGTES